MGWGTGNLGGGSGGLNFKVVGYATEAELLADTPKENTIGVITEHKITGWMFDVSKPTKPVEGMVWFATELDSDIPFNALKKNGIQVYPTAASQYINGAWVDVTAMSYQGGKWVEWWTWDGTLFNAGDQVTDITGGWEKKSGMYIANQPTATSTPTIGDTLKCVAAGNSSCIVGTKNKVSLANFSTLHITVTSATSSWQCAIVSSNTGDIHNNYITRLAPSSAGTYTLDVKSLTDSYYIAFGTNNGRTAVASKIWLT